LTSYRLFPATNGPSTVVTFSGSLICGVTFMVTSEAYFEGYWWWVAPSGQSTSPVKCALWCEKSGSGDLVPGSVVTSGTLTAGQWNFIPLPAPIPLSLGASAATWPASNGAASYVAAIGVNGSFPETQHQFGTGNPFSAGITSGPLTAFSAPSGTLPSTWSNNQGCFTTGGSDPAVTMPRAADNDANLWVDVQVTNVAPGGISLRLWPNLPTADASPIGNDTTTSSSATEFRLSQSCKLNRIWFYSPAGALNLPQRCGIWNIATQTVVAGTDISGPTWSGAVTSGWVSVDYTSANITLPAGSYKVATWNGIAQNYYTDTEQVFNPGGPNASGITYGPLFAPNAANGTPVPWDDSSGTKPAQDTYQPGAWAYPNTGETKVGAITGESRWQDVEVTPVAVPAPAPAQPGRTWLRRFHHRQRPQQAPAAGAATAAASGALDITGAAAASAAATASGALALAGTASVQAAAAAAGTITLAGTATAQAVAAAAGTVTLAGTATATGPGTTASGALAITGTAAGAAPAAAAGSLVLSGTAAAGASAAAAGSVALSGTAAATGPGTTASGALALAGTATAQGGAPTIGAVTLTGTATGRAAAAAGGLLALAGTAAPRAAATAAGTITLAGAAQFLAPVTYGTARQGVMAVPSAVAGQMTLAHAEGGQQ
jgi:hypothetical protein